MGPVPETWQMFTEGRLQQLSELKQGWAGNEIDDTTGDPIHPYCIALARSIAFGIMRDFGVRPFIAPWVDGSVELEWEDAEGLQHVCVNVPIK